MTHDTLADSLQSLVDRTVGNRRIHNLVVGVASGDDAFGWAAAAGVADPESGEPMRPETPIAIASVTKMYTAAAAMMLRERGRLDTTDAITAHLPADLTRGLHRYRGHDYTEALTVGHLLGHTSGFPDYFLAKPRGGRSVYQRILDEGDRAWDLEDVVRYTREELGPVSAPAEPGAEGTRARYSDTNYKLLGAVLESASGRPLSQLFNELIFQPLGLRETRFFGHPRGGASGDDAMARVYHKDRPIALDRLLASHGPEGGLVSTVDEMIRFGRTLLTGGLFRRPETLADMRHWNRIFFPFRYGYGIMRFSVPRLLSPFGYNPVLIGHSGSSGSFLFHDPQLDLYMAGTFNQMTLQRAPFPLMIKAARAVRKQRG